MPIERATWVTVPFVTIKDAGVSILNARLARNFDLVDTANRVQAMTVTASATLSLTWPDTLVLVDSASGNVTLTLPPAAMVPGFRVQVKKTVAANTVTLDGHVSETIDGTTTLAWATQWQSYSVVATNGAWYVV